MEETVDLREYFGIVKKRFWIVALITIIAVVVSGVISFFMLNPVYEAKSTLIVNCEFCRFLRYFGAGRSCRSNIDTGGDAIGPGFSLSRRSGVRR